MKRPLPCNDRHESHEVPKDGGPQMRKQRLIVLVGARPYRCWRNGRSASKSAVAVHSSLLRASRMDARSHEREFDDVSPRMRGAAWRYEDSRRFTAYERKQTVYPIVSSHTVGTTKVPIRLRYLTPECRQLQRLNAGRHRGSGRAGKESSKQLRSSCRPHP